MPCFQTATTRETTETNTPRSGSVTLLTGRLLGHVILNYCNAVWARLVAAERLRQPGDSGDLGIAVRPVEQDCADAVGEQDAWLRPRHQQNADGYSGIQLSRALDTCATLQVEAFVDILARQAETSPIAAWIPTHTAPMGVLWCGVFDSIGVSVCGGTTTKRIVLKIALASIPGIITRGIIPTEFLMCKPYITIRPIIDRSHIVLS